MLNKPRTCQGCALHTLGTGFLQLDGQGTSRVLLVGEALGEQEALQGRPFIGPAGKILGDCFARAGLDRDAFWISNALWCQPPDNNIHGNYATQALHQCWTQHLWPLVQQLNPDVIMPLGNTALRQFFPEGEILSMRGYVQPWRTFNILPSVHPSYILRGNPHFASVLIRDLQAGVELAENGMQHPQTSYALDPGPPAAQAWVDEAIDQGKTISFDIETVDKRRDEDELDLRSNNPIKRISFAYEPWKALSIPATKAYSQVIASALASDNPKIVWNMAFDCPRLEAAGYTINGTVYDGMIAWHVLHSDLPKSLGFVASMLLRDQKRWKHLGRQSPAYYNAADSDVALRITQKCWQLLSESGMWRMYTEQVVDCEPVYQHMHKKGMRVDQERRKDHAMTLHKKLGELDDQIQDLVPAELKPHKLYKQKDKAEKKFPDGHVVMVKAEIKRCPDCGKEGKLNKKHPCASPLETVPQQVEAWEVPQPFVVSWQGIQRWQDYHKHKVVKRQGKRTTDETALRALMLKYPKDPLYPLVLDVREVQKLAGTYIGKVEADWETNDIKVVGGLPVLKDGRVHPTITNNPDTLRTSMVNPNLQQIPHGGGLQSLVKDMFVAPKGMTLWEIDYSGIEAVLVGYFARSPQLIRLAKMGVHDYVNAHALYQLDKAIPESDLPQLSWSDEDLRESLKSFKKNFPKQRFVRKRLVHGHHYRMGPHRAQEVLLKELNRVVPLKDIKAFFKFYDELFPEISQWQQGLCMKVDGTETESDPGLGITAGAGWVRNPSGMIHRYFQVLRWIRIADGTWSWTFGPAAKALIAFNPQHAAAAIGKRAIRDVAKEDPEALESLRLFIHDSLVGECPVRDVEDIMARVSAIMTRPVPWLPLPAEWNMGTHLSIEVEGKYGRSWADM